MLTQDTGRLSRKEQAAALWKFISTHPNRQKYTAGFFGFWYAVINNQWEVRTDAHVIPGTNTGVDWGMYVGQVLMFTAICGFMGTTLDRSRELKKGAGVAEDTQPWRERYAQATTWKAKARVLAFDVSPKHLLGVVTMGAQFFQPLMLHTLFSGDPEPGISAAQGAYKGFKALYFFSAAFYAGYVLASIALNMKFAKKQTEAKLERDCLMGDEEDPSINPLSNGDSLSATLINQEQKKSMRERFDNNKMTILLPLSYITMALILDLWMMTTDRPAIGNASAGNELAFLTYAGLLAIPAIVAGATADTTRGNMKMANVEEPSNPLTKAKVSKTTIGFVALWTLSFACAATTIGMFKPGVVIPDIHDDSDASQYMWKIFLCGTMFAAATASAVVQRTVYTGAKLLSNSMVGKLGGRVRSSSQEEYDDGSAVDISYDQSGMPNPL